MPLPAVVAKRYMWYPFTVGRIRRRTSDIPNKNVTSMFSSERFLGIDFGTESIKAVELRLRGGRPFISNYGEAVLFPKDRKRVSARSLKEEIAVRFHALLERMRPETDEICIAIPSYLGLIFLVDFPDMTEQELDEAVRFEARKYIPSPLEDVSLSWELVGEREVSESGKPIRTSEVLLVAALQKDIQQYERYVNAVGYRMKLLELETFSISRALASDEPSPVLVVDVGARATNLILVEGGFPKKSRSIDTGGRDITQTLSESLNISIDRADEMKKGKKDFLNARDVALILTPVETILNESKRIIGAWEKKRPDRKVSKVILSGGTARLTGLPGYVSGKLSLPVEIGNPWKHISFAPELGQKAQERMGPSFSVAAGLALYGLRSRIGPDTDGK